MTLLTDAVAERTDRAPALASDLARDPLRDLLPLPDPELHPDKLNELEWLPLDPRPDAELSLEEEVPDCDHSGEGDLAHLRLEGERTAGAGSREEDFARELSQTLFETWTGAVEVKAAGITLALLTGLPRVLWMMASFKMSLAFLPPSKDGA